MAKKSLLQCLFRLIFFQFQRRLIVTVKHQHLKRILLYAHFIHFSMVTVKITQQLLLNLSPFRQNIPILKKTRLPQVKYTLKISFNCMQIFIHIWKWYNATHIRKDRHYIQLHFLESLINKACKFMKKTEIEKTILVTIFSAVEDRRLYK